jgi:hypothetical protein
LQISFDFVEYVSAQPIGHLTNLSQPIQDEKQQVVGNGNSKYE